MRSNDFHGFGSTVITDFRLDLLSGLCGRIDTMSLSDAVIF